MTETGGDEQKRSSDRNSGSSSDSSPSPLHLPPSPFVYAIVPAAGLSRRMGRPKLSLPLGSKSVLEHVLAALAKSGVARTVVVLGQTSRHLVDRVHGRDIETLTLAEDTADMRATVTAGLRFFTERYAPGPSDAFLLALADQPTVCSEVIDLLIEAHRTDSTRIRVPTFAGKRGHPVLFPWSMTTELAELPADVGLNRLLQNHPDRVAELPTDRESVLSDLDDPSDYARHQRRDWD